jgi:hypothetical protein
MRIQGFVAALGLASLTVVFQAGSAVSATLNLEYQTSRGTVSDSTTSLGSIIDIVPSYTVDSSTITYTTDVQGRTVATVGSVGFAFFFRDTASTNNDPIIPDFLAALPNYSAGTASFIFTNLGFANNNLTLGYNGNLSFSDNILNPPTLAVSSRGTVVLPNFGNVDPNDVPTYIQNNLELSALNNFTLNLSETTVFRGNSNGNYQVVLRSAGLITSVAVPFEFSPALGLGVLGGLFAFKRFAKKKKAS